MWLLLVSNAYALDWYLESPDRADRSEPSAVFESAVAAGFDARVVRRFTEGEGWRYVARINGFADGASARIAAGEIAAATGVAMVIIEIEGDVVSKIADVVPGRAPEVGAPPAEEAADTKEEASALLAAIAAAHAAGAEILTDLRSRSVRFEYRRTLPDGRVAQHRWATDKGAAYLEVWGDVSARRLRVFPDRAELSVDGAPFESQKLEPSMAITASLGPSAIIPVVLALPSAVEIRREFQAMEIVGSGEIDGLETVLLNFGGDETSGPIDLEVGVQDHLVRRVSFDDNARVYELTDYRPVAGAMLPFSIASRHNDGAPDRVQIDRFEIGTTLPGDWFADER